MYDLTSITILLGNPITTVKLFNFLEKMYSNIEVNGNSLTIMDLESKPICLPITDTTFRVISNNMSNVLYNYNELVQYLNSL